MRTVAYSGMFLATGLASAVAADPTGDWRVADGVANIRVAECNGSMWGVVAWEKTPGGRDMNNPDVSKQNRPTLGMPILIDMKKKPGTDQWEGQVYNAKDGQSYSSTIKPVGPDQLLVLPFDELRARPVSAYRRIQSFLDTTVMPTNQSEKRYWPTCQLTWRSENQEAR